MSTLLRSFFLAVIMPAMGIMLPLSSTPVLAQTSATGSGLVEIVVTARRREESLVDTPVSITAFSADDIEFRQINRSNEIAEATPNLVFRAGVNGSNIASVVYIRGIGQFETGPTTQPGVGLYVDDAYVARSHGSVSEILDLESIEVLRGPQGTLFGRNTIGGAVVMITKKPNEVLEGEVEVQVGERNHRQAKAIVNIPFSDNFFGKFAALYRERDGWIDTPNIEGDDGFGSQEVKAVRAALRWQTDAVTVDVYVDHSNRKSDGAAFINTALNETSPTSEIFRFNNIVRPVSNGLYGVGLGPITAALYVPPEGSYINYSGNELGNNQAGADVTSTGLTITWDINDSLRFKSITNYRDLDSFDARDEDMSPEPAAHITGINQSEQFTQEFQLSGTAMDDRLNWLVGLYHFQEESVDANPVIFPFFSVVSGAVVDNKSDAVFGQLTYDFTDQLSLTLGARYSDERFDSIVDDSVQYITELFNPACGGPCTTQPPPSTIDGNDVWGRRGGQPAYLPFPAPPQPGFANIQPNRVFETDKDDIEPYINLAYRWNDALMTYISYSEGFKGGGFTQRIPPGGTVQSFGPEKAKVYELGGKFQSLDDRFRLTGAVFYTDYTDLQVAVSQLLGGGLQNASNAEIKGFELEAVAALGEGFVLSGGVGYLDPKYKDVDPGVAFSPENRMPNTQEWQFNISGMYTTQVGDGTLRARLDYSYQDDFFAAAQNQVLTPSYDLLNGFISYTTGSGEWEFALQGRNLLDEFYYDSITGNILSNGHHAAWSGAPRQVVFRVKYSFGGE